MKSLEELALTTSDITAILPKVIKKGIEEVRRPKLYMLQLFRENRELVGKAGKSLHVTIGGRVGYAIVSEGSALSSSLSAQKKTLTDVQITPVKIGTWFEITYETILSAMYDIVDMHVETASLDMAEGLDTYLYQILVGTASTTETISGTGTSTYSLSHGKILAIKGTVTVGGSATSGYYVDYYDGKIQLKSTTSSNIQVSYVYSTRTHVFDASTTSKLTYSDFITARSKLISNRFQPNVAIISPNLEGDVLKDSRFVDNSKYPHDVLFNGEIGKIAGLRVIPTIVAYDVLVVTDAPKQGLVVWKMPLEIYVDEDFDKLCKKIYLYEIVGAKTLWDDAVAIVVNTQSNAKNL